MGQLELNMSSESDFGNEVDLSTVLEHMRSFGASRFVAKRLSPNDNSKNQIYLGSAINVIPNNGIRVESVGGKRPRHIADVEFAWVTSSGVLSPAPHAKLILYPKYPEVRLSGFLLGSQHAPGFLAGRAERRILILGLSDTGKVFGHAAGEGSTISNFFWREGFEPSKALFDVLDPEGNSKSVLISKLRDLHRHGWTEGKSLKSTGLVPCNSSQCIGYTLEAELGVPRNSLKLPDYKGWELKAHTVREFAKPVTSSPISLFTPEPDGGLYHEEGFDRFMRRYGYPDVKGRPGRINYGGIYKNGVPGTKTGATLFIEGFDQQSRKITDLDGKVGLEAGDGNLIMSWSFKHILNSWMKKHEQAAYVPAISKSESGVRHYWYGPDVRLGEGTNFRRFLIALSEGAVYLDPAHKHVTDGDLVDTHRRTQWRIKSSDIPSLYEKVTTVSVS